ncbi:MAG: hypothetical protein EA377_10925 [Phycisphaerales bacterium]|nr:MAG: hypothetical protein EA377_10925 [Phycisphaerales bacterium]
MPIMDGLKRFFTRRENPVAVDLNTPPERNENHATENSAVQEPPRPELIEARPSKPRNLAELQRGYDEIMGLVRKIGDHLDSQSERTERLVELMDRLPETLDALPEINRQNARLLEVLTEHLTQVKSREDNLTSTLQRMSNASNHHTEVLGLLQQQLDQNGRASQQMTETLSGFREALTGLAGTNTRSADLLSKIAENSQERESQLITMFERSQRWMMGIAIGIGTLAAIGIVLGVIALMN